MKIVVSVIAIVLFVGGMALFGYSWDGTVFDVYMFMGGLVAITLSLVIPFHVLKRIDG